MLFFHMSGECFPPKKTTFKKLHVELLVFHRFLRLLFESLSRLNFYSTGVKLPKLFKLNFKKNYDPNFTHDFLLHEYSFVNFSRIIN